MCFIAFKELKFYYFAKLGALNVIKLFFDRNLRKMIFFISVKLTFKLKFWQNLAIFRQDDQVRFPFRWNLIVISMPNLAVKSDFVGIISPIITSSRLPCWNERKKLFTQKSRKTLKICSKKVKNFCSLF